MVHPNYEVMSLKIDTSQVLRLRDRLLITGSPSVNETFAGLSEHERRATMLRVAPFAELMFLVMVSDHTIKDSERAALRGAFRVLTGGKIGTRSLNRLLEDCERALEEQGYDDRLESICSQLALDRNDAEGAFRLAAAMSLADGVLRDEERQLLGQLASWLGLGRRRAEALLNQARRTH